MPHCTAEQLRAATVDCVGTENWYRHALNRTVTYTDGVKAFADTAGAHWLLDILATELPEAARLHGIIFITLKVDSPADIQLFAQRDSDQPAFWTRPLEFTDCPAGTWQIWMAPGGPENTVVILLPDEY